MSLISDLREWWRARCYERDLRAACHGYLGVPFSDWPKERQDIYRRVLARRPW